LRKYLVGETILPDRGKKIEKKKIRLREIKEEAVGSVVLAPLIGLYWRL